jgi:hypothetical protein
MMPRIQDQSDHYSATLQNCLYLCTIKDYCGCTCQGTTGCNAGLPGHVIRIASVRNHAMHYTTS